MLKRTIYQIKQKLESSDSLVIMMTVPHPHESIEPIITGRLVPDLIKCGYSPVTYKKSVLSITVAASSGEASDCGFPLSMDLYNEIMSNSKIVECVMEEISAKINQMVEDNTKEIIQKVPSYGIKKITQKLEQAGYKITSYNEGIIIGFPS